MARGWAAQLVIFGWKMTPASFTERKAHDTEEQQSRFEVSPNGEKPTVGIAPTTKVSTSIRAATCEAASPLGRNRTDDLDF
jgi:hypothetical protein